jgi:hypothetical protein
MQSPEATWSRPSCGAPWKVVLSDRLLRLDSYTYAARDVCRWADCLNLSAQHGTSGAEFQCCMCPAEGVRFSMNVTRVADHFKRLADTGGTFGLADCGPDRRKSADYDHSQNFSQVRLPQKPESTSLTRMTEKRRRSRPSCIRASPCLCTFMSQVQPIRTSLRPTRLPSAVHPRLCEVRFIIRNARHSSGRDTSATLETVTRQLKLAYDI